MSPPKKNRVCSVEGCGRKHAAHGYCLMHYKRLKKHGSPEYRWGGKVIGRPCKYCDRPAVALDMCWRHYQMGRKHGDPLFADNCKVDNLPPGITNRKGYVAIGGQFSAEYVTNLVDPRIEKTHSPHKRTLNQIEKGRGNGKTKRELVHRIVVDAKVGEIVHHINGNKTDNVIENLHIFPNQSPHTKCHKSLESVGYLLVEAGVIVFDPVDGVYKLDQFFAQSMT